MFVLHLVLSFILVGVALCQLPQIIPTVTTTTQKSSGKNVDPYLPHATYLSANSYVDNVPYGVAYNAKPPQSTGYYSYINGMMPSASTTLEIVLWVFARIGTVAFGAAGLFLLGAVFNAVICNFTSFCTYDFHGFDALDNESVRSLITPEKISTAAALVQDAIGKYNRMQREIRN